MAADKKKRQYRLNHHCFKKGLEGEPGAVIEVDDAGATWLDEVGGGHEVDADGKPLEKKTDEAKKKS